MSESLSRRLRAVRSQTTDKRFEDLVPTSASIVWWSNATGEIAEEQPYWQEYTGQTWEEYRGSGWIAAVHPDDRAAITADWSNAVTTASNYVRQGRIWSAKLQSYRTFQARGIPILDDTGRVLEWLGALTDIQDAIDVKSLLQHTEQDLASSVQALRTSEAQYRESETRFRTMADSAPVLIWMSGPDKLCTYFNQGWLNFTGRPLAAEIGNGWAEGVHPDDMEQCVTSYETAFDARRPFDIEYRLRRHDGEYRWVIDRGVPRYDSNGAFCGYIGSVMDISERRQLEENNRHFAHMQRLALVGELSAVIAHEVRQPVNAISLNANVGQEILRSADPAYGEVEEILADIEQAAKRANDVLDRIRDFLSRRKPSMDTIDINALVRDALRLTSDEALKRRINTNLRLSPDILEVKGDHTQLMQVLLNLILNAMDSMKNSNAPDRSLTLASERHGNLVEVSVSDSGAGIGAEVMPRLFEPFFTTRNDGMGIGLSIAKSIIDAHRGRIWADNNAGNGATFHFSLPITNI
jgi:PAS domain S-box-containing protein